MTNEERRQALNEARNKAVEWAVKAQECSAHDYVVVSELGQEATVMANMWANVAQALKSGDAVHDEPRTQR